MEHINPLFGSRFSAIKSLKFPSFWKSLSKIDSVFTISMIVFGILGCLSVLYLQATPERHLDNSLILTGSSPGQAPISAASAIATSIQADDDLQPRFVHIEGTRTAGQSLTFVIDAFEAAASYSFDFGDGKTLKVTDRRTDYSYRRSGLYKVLLNVTFQGETKQVPIESVWIAK